MHIPPYRITRGQSNDGVSSRRVLDWWAWNKFSGAGCHPVEPKSEKKLSASRSFSQYNESAIGSVFSHWFTTGLHPSGMCEFWSLGNDTLRQADCQKFPRFPNGPHLREIVKASNWGDADRRHFFLRVKVTGYWK